MQVTIDIPDDTYRRLEVLAELRQQTVSDVLDEQLRKLDGIPVTTEELARRYPLLQSKHPNSLTVEQVAEFDLFDPS